MKLLLSTYIYCSIFILVMFFGCSSESEKFEQSTDIQEAKVEIDFKAQMFSYLKTSTDNLSDIELAALECPGEEWSSGVGIDITILDEEGFEIVNRVLSYIEIASGGVASELLLFEPGTYFITKFVIVDTDGDAIYATPEQLSSFDGFVSTPLPHQFQVVENQKDRVELEVICFDKELAPTFGFTWFDYSIIEGNEFCMFVNCIGDTREDYHSVPTIFVELYENADDLEPYYSRSTDQMSDGIENPFCYPLYDELSDISGIIMDITTNQGEADEIKYRFYLSQDRLNTIINACDPANFVQVLPQSPWSDSNSDWTIFDLYSGISVDFMMAHDTGAEGGQCFFHFQLPTCSDQTLTNIP